MDGKLDEIGDDDRKRRDESGKVNFAENAGVRHKSGGGLCETGGEVVPRRDTGEVEEHRRQSIGGQFGKTAEDHREHGGGEQGLDEKPQRAENGLLVDRYKIPAHKHPKQVTVMPNIPELQIPPVRGRVEHHVPMVGVERRVFHVVKIQ